MQKVARQSTFSWANFLELKSPLVELMLGRIKEMYWAENHLVRTLLKVANSATNTELQHLLNHHLERTKIHCTKLEHVFELVDEIIDARKCDAMSGLAMEVDEMIEYTDEGTATRDIAMIFVCQKIEQYEITTYSALIKLASSLGREDIADVLKDILDDEIECHDSISDMTEVITLRAIDES